MMMINEGEFTDGSEYLGCELNAIQKKKGCKNSKRRFSDEQVKSLENIFESETKLEPRKKLQLARDLGLQPRQVAIWFQNKRARWKSKQLERDYGILLSDYNALSSQFEILKKEKQALLVQLQKLNEVMDRTKNEKSEGGKEPETRDGHGDGHGDGQSNHGEQEQHITKEAEVKPCASPDISEHGFAVLSDNDSSIRAEYLGLDGEPDLTNMVEPADGTSSSPEDWGGLDSSRLLDQPISTYQWWDFWR